MSDAEKGRPERRRGIVVLDDDVLSQILRLPDGLRVVAVSADWARIAVKIMVEGEGLEPCVPGCEPPTLPVELDWDPEAGKLSVAVLLPEERGETDADSGLSVRVPAEPGPVRSDAPSTDPEAHRASQGARGAGR